MPNMLSGSKEASEDENNVKVVPLSEQVWGICFKLPNNTNGYLINSKCSTPKEFMKKVLSLAHRLHASSEDAVTIIGPSRCVKCPYRCFGVSKITQCPEAY